jgi:hypothetical protein
MIGVTIVQQNSMPIRNSIEILNNLQETHNYQLPLVICADDDKPKGFYLSMAASHFQVLGSTSKSFSDKMPNFRSLT